jgi:hypothetical protein
MTAPYAAAPRLCSYRISTQPQPNPTQPLRDKVQLSTCAGKAQRPAATPQTQKQSRPHLMCLSPGSQSSKSQHCMCLFTKLTP